MGLTRLPHNARAPRRNTSHTSDAKLCCLGGGREPIFLYPSCAKHYPYALPHNHITIILADHRKTPGRIGTMATETHESTHKTKHHVVSEVEHSAEKEAKTFKDFFTKFNNDWVMNFSSGLAFSLLTAIFPIVIA